MRRIINVGQGSHFFYRHTLALLIAGGLLALLLLSLAVYSTSAQTATQTLRVANAAKLEVEQTVGEALGICAPTSVIAVTSGKTVYYCVTLRNTGTVTLTHHTLFSSSSKITATIAQTISPGAEFAVTSNMLSSPGVLSGIITGAVDRVTNTITVTSTAGATTVVTGTATVRVFIGTVGVKVTKTVGLSESSCATTTGIAVGQDNTKVVYYCVTFQNTGTLPLTKHYLRDPLLNIDYNAETIPILPKQSVVVTKEIIPQFEYSVGQDITNTVFFTSTTAEGVSVSTQAQAFVLIGRASTVLTYTIGSNTDPCRTSTALTIVSGQPVQHCLRLNNNGTIPLETHTLQWLQNNVQILSTTITQTLQPGQSMVISSTRIPELAQGSVPASANHNMTITSRNQQGVTTTASQSAQVTIGAQALSVQKYASTDRNVCLTRPLPTIPLNIIATQAFYYCLVVTNSGAIPLVRHTFSEGAPLNLSGAFTYTIQPGQRVTLTNNFFTSTLGMLPLLGPFNATVNMPGSLVFTSFAANNVQATPQTVAFQINVTAPTPTTTPPPTPFPTFTPTISPTPTPSLTSPPTLTPTPVVVSFQPTPTPLFGIGSVSTPTPGVFAGSIPDQPPSPLDPAIPTVDITSTLIMQTAEAAATQTALAFIPPPVIDTPIPLPTETSLPTPTAVTTPTVTPFVLVIAPLPAPASSGNYLDVTAQVFQVSTATLGWIWFLGGSIVFFATAGIFAGLSLQQRRRQRHDIFAMEEDGNLDDHTFEPMAVAPITPPDRSSRQAADDNADDYWPASLR